MLGLKNNMCMGLASSGSLLWCCIRYYAFTVQQKASYMTNEYVI